MSSARSCLRWAWPRAATGTRGTRSPGARQRSMPLPGKPWRGHPGPVAAPTATGASRRGPTQAASREGASASGRPRRHGRGGPGREGGEEKTAPRLLWGRDLRGAPEPASRRAGEARLRGRRPQREVGDRRDRVPHPGWQGLSLADRGLLRRHAAELVDLDLARRGDGKLVAARRVRVAARGRPSDRALGQGQPLSLAGVDRDLRGGRPGQVDVEEGGAAPATRGARASSAASR